MGRAHLLTCPPAHEHGLAGCPPLPGPSQGFLGNFSNKLLHPNPGAPEVVALHGLFRPATLPPTLLCSTDSTACRTT